MKLIRIGELTLTEKELKELIKALRERLYLADYADNPEDRDRDIDQLTILSTIH
jgi:hypothetical protein